MAKLAKAAALKAAAPSGACGFESRPGHCVEEREKVQHPPACPRCGHSNTVRSPSGGWTCRHTWTETVPGRVIAVAPNNNPLAPGPYPGIPIFEWHPQTVSCGSVFTDAEAKEFARRRREEIRRRQEEAEQQKLREQRQREIDGRVAIVERERDAALGELPPVTKPSPVDKNEIRGQGCAIGCGLWTAVIAISLVMLGVNGQLSSDSDPTILGVENPLLFLPVMWLTGWLISSVRLAVAREKHRMAEAEADRRAEEHAQVRADFDRRIAAIRRASQ